jgi:hypothetical protein
VWRENIIAENNYVHDCGGNGGVGIYMGWPTDDIPLRNITYRYNIVEDTGYDCTNLKSARTGTNAVHHNKFYRCTGSTTDPHGVGIDVGDGGNLAIYNNWIEDTDWQCIRASHRSTTPDGADAYFYIYNNMCIRPGADPRGTSEGIRLGRDTAAYDYNPVRIYNNTVISPDGNCVTLSNVSTSNSTVRDNILAGCGGSAVSGATGTNNSTGTVASQDFAGVGSDNYELTSTSPACNQAANPFGLTTDYEDEARPQDSANDQGADEAVACP